MLKRRPTSRRNLRRTLSRVCLSGRHSPFQDEAVLGEMMREQSSTKVSNGLTSPKADAGSGLVLLSTDAFASVRPKEEVSVFPTKPANDHAGAASHWRRPSRRLPPRSSSPDAHRYAVETRRGSPVSCSRSEGTLTIFQLAKRSEMEGKCRVISLFRRHDRECL
jgi:hypothetical protein